MVNIGSIWGTARSSLNVSRTSQTIRYFSVRDFLFNNLNFHFMIHNNTHII